jgi:hypothetical protein
MKDPTPEPTKLPTKDPTPEVSITTIVTNTDV